MELNWNEFRKKNRGSGKSMQELSQEYSSRRSSSSSYEFSQPFRGSRSSSGEYILTEPTFSHSRKSSSELWDVSSKKLLKEMKPQLSRFKEKALSFLHYQHSDILCVALPIRAYKSKKDQITWTTTTKTRKDGTISVKTHLEASDILMKEILRCMNGPTRFVAIPIKLEQVKYINKIKDTHGHANILLIDKVEKVIERYDPFGDRSSYRPKNLNRELKKRLQNIVAFPFRYVAGNDLCPMGLQRQQGQEKDKKGAHGMCVPWSVFYLDLRMTYPNLSPKDLEELAIRRLKDGGMSRFIKNYTAYLQRL